MSVFTEVERQIQAAMRSARTRFNNMLRRAVIKIIDDAKKQQELQLELFRDEENPEETETQDEVENFAHSYGMTAHPPKESEAILARLGGSGDTQVVLATANRAVRPKLEAEGDVTIYDKDGQMIELKRSKIVITLDGSNELELGAGATLGVARDTDPVRVTIPAGTFVTAVAGPGVTSVTLNPAPVDVDGTIQDGSSVVKAVD